VEVGNGDVAGLGFVASFCDANATAEKGQHIIFRERFGGRVIMFRFFSNGSIAYLPFLIGVDTTASTLSQI